MNCPKCNDSPVYCDHWIGVDFDETLRRHDGTAIMPTVSRILDWLSAGFDVRVVSARFVPEYLHHDPDWLEQNGGPDQRGFVRRWCAEVLGFELPLQWGKSKGMLELWDDKVVRVEANTGTRLSPSVMEDGASNLVVVDISVARDQERRKFIEEIADRGCDVPQFCGTTRPPCLACRAAKLLGDRDFNDQLQSLEDEIAEKVFEELRGEEG